MLERAVEARRLGEHRDRRRAGVGVGRDARGDILARTAQRPCAANAASAPRSDRSRTARRSAGAGAGVRTVRSSCARGRALRIAQHAARLAAPCCSRKSPALIAGRSAAVARALGRREALSSSTARRAAVDGRRSAARCPPAGCRSRRRPPAPAPRRAAGIAVRAASSPPSTARSARALCAGIPARAGPAPGSARSP